MGKVPGNPWWAIGRSKQEAVPDTDYADMGTAFGLDASMAPPDWADDIDEDLPPGIDRLNGRSIR